MRHRITRIGILQTATVAGTIYAALGLLVVPFFYLVMRNVPAQPNVPFPFKGLQILFMPIIYGLVGFAFAALGAFMYNLVAGWVGGVEIELTPAGEGVGTAQ